MRVLEPLAKLQTLHLQELPDLSGADIASLAKLTTLRELRIALGKPNAPAVHDRHEVEAAAHLLKQHLPGARIQIRTVDNRSLEQRLRDGIFGPRDSIKRLVCVTL